jgi:hypothetical protein
MMTNLIKIVAGLFVARKFPRLFQLGMAYQKAKRGVRRL